MSAGYPPERHETVLGVTVDPRRWKGMCDELDRLRAEVERLNGWKAEAIAVLTEWDACYDVLAAGRPARLGSSKARHVRAEVERMRPVIEAARDWSLGWSRMPLVGDNAMVTTSDRTLWLAVAALDAGEQQ